MNTHDFTLNHDTGNCRQCGLPLTAHSPLPDHPEEDKLRGEEIQAATTLNRLAGRTAKTLREHNRIEAVVLLSQLTVVADQLRLAMRRAIEDQMGEVGEGFNRKRPKGNT